MSPYARCERLWRDVGDDSPWYEKALFHALGALEHGDNPADALAKIEAALADRPQEVDPTIYEAEAAAVLALASREEQPTSAQVEQVRDIHQAKRAVRGPEPETGDPR